VKTKYFVCSKQQSPSATTRGSRDFWLSSPFDSLSSAKDEASLLAATDQHYSEYFVLTSVYSVKKSLPELTVSEEKT
jgi:hypothetical protein